MRNLVLVLSLSSALMLAACGKKEEAAPIEPTAPAVEAPAAEATAPEAAAPAATEGTEAATEAAPAEAAPVEETAPAAE